MKLFVLVRKDLSHIQQAVQAGHAVAEFLREHRDTVWTNGILVYMGVDSLDDLMFWKQSLEHVGIGHSMFYEPDVSSNTALAFYYDGESSRARSFKRKMDHHLSLLKFG